MRSFPLVRSRWTNEHIMAALFAVLLLYMLPEWFLKPFEVASFIALLIFSLAVDAAASFIRYKRPVCPVSAAVTASILQILTPGVPLWGRLAGIVAALVLGKHIWGGTGKNLINPALTGLLLLGFLFKLEPAFAGPPLFFLPAMLLSLPFILFRPFAGAGLISGMALAMLSGGNTDILTVAVYCIFFGCLIATDPVTVTHKALPGLIGGFLAGFAPLMLTSSAYFLAIGILALNLVSYFVNLKINIPKDRSFGNLQRIKRPVPQNGIEGRILDLTGERAGEPEIIGIPEAGIVLERIEKHGVFGMGGAGFPTSKKLEAFMKADTSKKYLIINGVECDPGLIHDKWLLKNRLNDIYAGIDTLLNCTGLKKAYLALKNASGIPQKGNVEIVKVRDVYPAGAERLLIETVLGSKLPEGAPPAAEGVLVLNVQTVLAVYEAVFHGKDADTRYLTVSDLKNGKSMVVRVKLGNSIHNVLEKAYPGSALAFAGGGVMQSHMADDGDVIDTSTNFIASANIPNYKESPQCSHCGICSSVCPAGLESGRIAELVDAGRISDTSVYQPDKCLSCGSCSYACLAGRNLSARVREAKLHHASVKL